MKVNLAGDWRDTHTHTQVGTDLFATHGLKHLLQLDSKLLNVVEDDAGLGKRKIMTYKDRVLYAYTTLCTLYSLFKGAVSKI